MLQLLFIFQLLFFFTFQHNFHNFSWFIYLHYHCSSVHCYFLLSSTISIHSPFLSILPFLILPLLFIFQLLFPSPPPMHGALNTSRTKPISPLHRRPPHDTNLPAGRRSHTCSQLSMHSGNLKLSWISPPPRPTL